MLNSSINRTEQLPAAAFTYFQANDFMPKILVVENDEDNRLMLKILLETWNYRVLEAENGIEAVKIAREECPDLIVMDVKMPYLDGFDAARQIRQSAKISGVPIVFLSGCAESSYRSAASVAGGNEYLVKPFNFDELENTLGKYFCHR
jgi:CheY-like chemotaxis protein